MIFTAEPGHTGSYTMTQQSEILQWFKHGHCLTSLDALTRFNCWRLADVVFKLRAKGNDIQDRWITTSTGKRVKEYGLFLAPPSGEMFARETKGRPE